MQAGILYPVLKQGVADDLQEDRVPPEQVQTAVQVDPAPHQGLQEEEEQPRWAREGRPLTEATAEHHRWGSAGLEAGVLSARKGHTPSVRKADCSSQGLLLWPAYDAGPLIRQEEHSGSLAGIHGLQCCELRKRLLYTGVHPGKLDTTWWTNLLNNAGVLMVYH